MQLRWLVVFLFCARAFAATWYVRQDGGTLYNATHNPTNQCDGKHDAAYPGSGTNQPCAVNDVRWLYDDQQGDYAWVIAGGDTVILDSAASVAAVSGLVAASAAPANRIGWDYGGSCSGAGCGAGFTWCLGQGQCGIPAPPSGSPGAPTNIWGRNHGACSTTTTFPGAFTTTTVPDASKMFEMYGDFGLNTVLLLNGSHDVDVECIHITTHGDCMIHLSGSGITNPIPCSTSVPLSSYASEGIRLGTTACQSTYGCHLQDVWLSGFQDSGITDPLPSNGSVTYNVVRASYNVEAGINMDSSNGGATLPAGALITTNNLTLDFNGCNQKWPFITAVPIDYCSDQNTSGDGDGFATPGSSFGTFVNTKTTSIYNTQDGYDVGHNQDPGSVSWDKSIMYGNMGGSFKSGGESMTLTNSVSLGTCNRMTQPIAGVPSTFNTFLTEYCRSNGDNIGTNWLGGGSNEVIKIQNNFFTTYVQTGVQIDFQIQGTGTCTSCTFLLENNVGIAYNNTSTGGSHPPSMYNSMTATTDDHNTFYNYTNYSCAGTTVCADPLLVGEPPPLTNVTNAFGDAFNFNLSSSSPSSTSVPRLAGITTDFFGNARNSPTSAGAVQFSGVAPPTNLTVGGASKVGGSSTF